MKYTFPLDAMRPELVQDIVVDEIPSELVERIRSAEAEFLGTIQDDDKFQIHENMRSFHMALGTLPYRGFESFQNFLNADRDTKRAAREFFFEFATGETPLSESLASRMMDCNGYCVLLKHTLSSGAGWDIYREVNKRGVSTVHTELLTKRDFGYMRIDPTKQCGPLDSGFDKYVVADLQFAVGYEQEPILPVEEVLPLCANPYKQVDSTIFK